jgi:hypothetical protein
MKRSERWIELAKNVRLPRNLDLMPHRDQKISPVAACGAWSAKKKQVSRTPGGPVLVPRGAQRG